ncbi:MAG: osmotically-inducible protein OsmY [Francisellaceae bacterium]|jgi:osmotically-inducible protein OsmY
MKHNKIYLLFCAFSLAVLLPGCTAVVIGGVGAAGVAGANIGGSSVSLDTSADDTKIKASAISIINKYQQQQKSTNIEVTVFNHILLISGQVANKKIQTNITSEMAKISGVSKVFDQLTIGPPATLSDYTQDSWITTKIVSSLLSEGISSTKYKIVTENKVVYMMGAVSKEEGHQASNIASHVSGVKKVVNLYSYVMPDTESKVIKKQNDNAEIDNGNAVN